MKLSLQSQIDQIKVTVSGIEQQSRTALGQRRPPEMQRMYEFQAEALKAAARTLQWLRDNEPTIKQRMGNPDVE